MAAKTTKRRRPSKRSPKASGKAGPSSGGSRGGQSSASAAAGKRKAKSSRSRGASKKRNQRVKPPARKPAKRTRSRAKKKPPSRLRKLWRRHRQRLALLFIGVLLATGGTLFIGYGWFDARRPASAGDPVAVSWPAELSALQAAELLSDLGLTDSRLAMALYLRVTDGPACFEPGPHLLPSGATPRELIAALCRDDTRPLAKLTVPEGMHRFALAHRVHKLAIADADAFLHATADSAALYPQGVEPSAGGVPHSAEGYLFPATYDFPIDTAPAAVVRRLVAESDRRFRRLTAKHPGGWERLQAERSWGRREVLTVASMVEKEAVAAEERPIIASVFLNRLSDPAFKHLQSDPTAMYGCHALGDAVPACVDWDGKASGAVNRDPANVYSTYVTRGLPPGPICNPGEASIEAVLAPADTEYRYFVAKGGGRHTFSADYADHLQAIEALRRKRP